MNENIDGWGNPFPVHTQMYHAKSVQDALERFEPKKGEPTPPVEQCDWKELPAGWWDKTPKDTKSLDG